MTIFSSLRVGSILLVLFSSCLDVRAFSVSRSTGVNGRISRSHMQLYSTGNDESDIHVMVNGMPGPMATAAAEACLACVDVAPDFDELLSNGRVTSVLRRAASALLHLGPWAHSSWQLGPTIVRLDQ